jgi:hypothetical protein
MGKDEQREFDVRRSSLESSPYGTDKKFEHLQYYLALMGFRPPPATIHGFHPNW